MKRIAEFLDLPGVCLPEKRQEVLDMCEKLTDDLLAETVASLRVRVQFLLKAAQSDEVRQAVILTREHLQSLQKTYAL